MSISVLIATRHREAYLRQALLSVAAQDCPQNVEVVVVHDGQPGTGLPDFEQSSWMEVRYIEQPHAGRSAAINHAFSVSRARYVTVLDDDDLMAPTKLRTLSRLLEVNAFGQDVDVVFGLPQYIDPAGQAIRTPPNARDFMVSHPYATWPQFIRDQQWAVHGTACLYPRQLWIDAGQWDEQLEGCEEYEYNLRLLYRGATFYGVPEVTDLYRIHGGQKSGRKARRTARRLKSRRRVRAKIELWQRGVIRG